MAYFLYLDVQEDIPCSFMDEKNLGRNGLLKVEVRAAVFSKYLFLVVLLCLWMGQLQDLQFLNFNLFLYFRLSRMELYEF